MAEAQYRTMADAKLIRISQEAHHATRIGAAIEDMKMEDWASWALIEMSKQVRAQGFRAPATKRKGR